MGTSERYSSISVKDNCTLFSAILYFRAWAIWRCHLRSPYNDLRCHGIQFWEKIWL